MNSGASSAREITARGRSMRPLLPDGSRVTFAARPPDQIRAGSIIAFTRDSALVLHRVIGIRRRNSQLEFREKGDSAPAASWVPARDVAGVAVRAEHRGRCIYLDVDPARFGIRWMTWMSWIEACFFFPLNLVPRLAGRLAAGVYPAGAIVEPEPDLASLLQLFRCLASDETVWPAVTEALVPLATRHGLDTAWAANRDDPRLTRLRHAAAFQSIALERALARTGEVLARQGIDFILLKGPSLAQRLYGDAARRASADLDLLVRAGDRDRAIAALVAAGFVPRSGPVARALIRRFHFHAAFDAPTHPPVVVEVHWELVDRANLYRIDEADVWSASRADAVNGVGIRMLEPAREFIYLCLHAAKHGFLNGDALNARVPATWYARAASGNRLIWWLDLATCLRRAGVEARSVADISKRWNCGEIVFQCLEVLNVLCPQAAVSAVMEALVVLRGPRAEGALKMPSGSMTAHPILVVRPARLSTLGRLLFPDRARRAAYYGGDSAWRAWSHPLRMLWRWMRG